MTRKTILFLLVTAAALPVSGQTYSPEIVYELMPPIENSAVSFSLEVSQQPGEMDTQIFSVGADDGYFDFSGLAQNDIIGSGWGVFLDGQCDETYARGDGGFGPDYVCNEMLDSEVAILLSIYAVDLEANAASTVLTIIQSSNPEYPIGFSPAGAMLSNLSAGVSIDVAYLQPDPGNITQGYSSLLTIDGLFNTPAAGSLQLTAQFTPEEGDPFVDYQEIPVFVPGCTDPTAINYDPAAGWDDGSCQFEAVPGDVNGDGVADVVDIVQMVNFILGYIELSPEAQAIGDVYPDGQITILDVVTLVDWIIN
ncbi:MAG: hypothetical protein GXO91_05070 [FCB group bacterium]|nr:hypothetical protein [FCB group bacterium]